MNKGIFITLEGGEGTGKSTLIANLAKRLVELGHPPVLTREPGGTPLAEAVRALALFPPQDESWSPLAQALLMNAARADHLEKNIIPSLEAGQWVLCDRFADSTRAYQSIDGVSQAALLEIEHTVVADAAPDITFVLDADPSLLIERRVQRGGSDAFEAKPLEFHEKVRAAFLMIAEYEPDRCVILDALQAPGALANQAISTLQNRGFLT